jgi:hypothetical protein
MPMMPSDYLTGSETALAQAGHHRNDRERAPLWIGEAQVMALQAIAAALDRLAAAVEAIAAE